MPFASIYPTDPRTNPAQFGNKYWELTNLKIIVFLRGPFWTFFKKKMLNPMKSSQRFLGSKDGSKFWWLLGFPAHEVLGQYLYTGLYKRFLNRRTKEGKSITTYKSESGPGTNWILYGEMTDSSQISLESYKGDFLYTKDNK